MFLVLIFKSCWKEIEVEYKLNNLADILAPLCKRIVPEAYEYQILHEHEGLECSLGNKSERPFTGVTACLNFSAHIHKDVFDLLNGCSVITTLNEVAIIVIIEIKTYFNGVKHWQPKTIFVY